MIPVIFICGPTAVGKTQYAIKLAQDLDGEIVSADCMQIYRYMDIGSAKPTQEERLQAVHHLIDFLSPKDNFTAADYQKLALKTIEDIYSRKKTVIVSGGTGLYINSLVYDMDYNAPAGDENYRKAIFEAENGDIEKLWHRLILLDPKAPMQVHKNNIQRVLRAIERLEKGEEFLKPFSEMKKPSQYIKPILIALNRDRDKLYRRCDMRVEALFKAGLVEEIQNLLKMQLTKEDMSMKGIGYKEIIEALENGFSMDSAKEQIKLNTRHYAKRQLTWLRRYENMHWIELTDEKFDEKAYMQILDFIKKEMK